MYFTLFNAKTLYPFKTPYIFLSGLWQPRDSLVLVEVCGDLQRGGCHSAAGGMVLGGDGGTVGQWEVPVPQVCVGQDPATQVNRRLQGERLCTPGVYFFFRAKFDHLFFLFNPKSKHFYTLMKRIWKQNFRKAKFVLMYLCWPKVRICFYSLLRKKKEKEEQVITLC